MTHRYTASDSTDSIAIGNMQDAARLTRLPMSTGRPRGYRVHVDGLGRLMWCYAHNGGLNLQGYVSRNWARAQGHSV
jgi:hypothetical protein